MTSSERDSFPPFSLQITRRKLNPHLRTLPNSNHPPGHISSLWCWPRDDDAECHSSANECPKLVCSGPNCSSRGVAGVCGGRNLYAPLRKGKCFAKCRILMAPEWSIAQTPAPSATTPCMSAHRERCLGKATPSTVPQPAAMRIKEVSTSSSKVLLASWPTKLKESLFGLPRKLLDPAL